MYFQFNFWQFFSVGTENIKPIPTMELFLYASHQNIQYNPLKVVSANTNFWITSMPQYPGFDSHV